MGRHPWKAPDHFQSYTMAPTCQASRKIFFVRFPHPCGRCENPAPGRVASSRASPSNILSLPHTNAYLWRVARYPDIYDAVILRAAVWAARRPLSFRAENLNFALNPNGSAVDMVRFAQDDTCRCHYISLASLAICFRSARSAKERRRTWPPPHKWPCLKLFTSPVDPRYSSPDC